MRVRRRRRRECLHKQISKNVYVLRMEERGGQKRSQNGHKIDDNARRGNAAAFERGANCVRRRRQFIQALTSRMQRGGALLIWGQRVALSCIKISFPQIQYPFFALRRMYCTGASLHSHLTLDLLLLLLILQLAWLLSLLFSLSPAAYNRHLIKNGRQSLFLSLSWKRLEFLIMLPVYIQSRQPSSPALLSLSLSYIRLSPPTSPFLFPALRSKQ